jgi:signal transduction histidine kinase
LNEERINLKIGNKIILFQGKECWLFMVNDITGIIRQEQMEAMNKAKDQWVATTSHELKTPLNAIIGMHSLLDDLVPSHQGKEYLKVANTSTKLMLNLVHDILDYSQIIAGKFRVNLKNFSIESAVEEAVSLMSY